MNVHLSQKQATLLMVMFIIGSSTLMVMGLEAKRDIWIAVILAMVAAALIMLIYVRLLTVCPDKNFFQTMEFYLGKVGSKIAIGLLTWFSLDLCSLVLRNYAKFIYTIALTETPLQLIMALMMVVCAISVKYGIDTIGHWSETATFAVIIFLIISVALVSENMDINSILPVFDEGIKPILKVPLAS